MSDKNQQTVLIGGVEKRPIEIVEYDPLWPNKFQEHAKIIADALKGTAIQIEHVGSTAVPNLAAKPIIDIFLIVADSSDEASYLPQLEEAGYVLRVREPDWHEHRMLRTPAKDVHIHVYSFGSSEIERHLRFRDHLRTESDDRKLYEFTKRKLAGQDWPSMDAYAQAKTEVIEQITANALDQKFRS